jgi:ubiquinone/menaquinone biosynthesis C-methylase UbiE
VSARYPTNPPEERSVRALVFGTAAGVYERSRPGYPVEAVRDLLGDRPVDVLDLGAGTGKLTRALVAAGHRTVAADPDAGMLAQLRLVLPDVETYRAPAESLPFPDGSFDGVVAGQAAHWFDPDVAMPEIARVLRPGGRLGLFWNLRDESVGWVARFGELVGSEDSVRYALDDVGTAEIGPGFRPAVVRTYDHVVPMTVDQVVDLGHSRSSLLAMREDDRERRLAAIRELAESAATDGGLAMPYRLQVWAAPRA